MIGDVEIPKEEVAIVIEPGKIMDEFEIVAKQR